MINKIFSERILWILQRASALFNLLIIVYIFSTLKLSIITDYSQILFWLNQNFNKFIIFILFVSVAGHASFGVSVVLHDYIHDKKIKNILLISKNLLVVIFWFFSGICLYFI